MDEQKQKRTTPWLSLLSLTILVVIFFMLVAVENKIDDVRITALRAESAASNASEQAYTAANNASDAKDSADEATNAANEAADYAANCPGN